MPNPTLEYEAVLEWLRSKPADEEVGVTNDNCRCPLANYLRDNGAPVPAVDYEFYQTGNEIITVPTPLWVPEFIHQVDRHDKWKPNAPDFRPVPAGVALAILEDLR